MLASSPLVSVVIPAYNAERYLRETVNSVVSQSLVDWELIIVDDGSTDETAEVATSCAQVDNRIRVVRQENRGLSGARNRGYEEASPESRFFLFLDADDILKPYALEWLCAEYARNEAAKIVFGFWSYIDDKGLPLHPGFVPNPLNERFAYRNGRFVRVPWQDPTTFDVMIVGNCIQTPGAVLIPRASLQEVGLFDPVLRCLEDWDLWLRISAAGEIGSSRNVVLEYRIHGNNMSARRPFMIRGDLFVRKKVLSSEALGVKNVVLAKAAMYALYKTDAKYLELLIEVRQIIMAARNRRKGFSKSTGIQEEQSPELLGVDLLLLLALDGDKTTADKVLASTVPEGKIEPFSSEELRNLSRAVAFLYSEEFRFRSGQIRAFFAQGKIVQATRNIYRAAQCLSRMSTAHPLNNSIVG